MCFEPSIINSRQERKEYKPTGLRSVLIFYICLNEIFSDFSWTNVTCPFSFLFTHVFWLSLCLRVSVLFCRPLRLAPFHTSFWPNLISCHHWGKKKLVTTTPVLSSDEGVGRLIKFRIHQVLQQHEHEAQCCSGITIFFCSIAKQFVSRLAFPPQI